MIMFLNHLILALGIIALYSCNTIEYNYPEEKKKLLEKILQNPDSITSIVKNSIFYDEKVIEEFYKKHKRNYLEFKETSYSVIHCLKELQNSKFEYYLDDEVPSIWNVREPDSKKGETYKDVDYDYYIQNLFGVVFPNEVVGYGIFFIKFNGKYYFDEITICNKDNEYLTGLSYCSLFELYKIKK